MALLTLADLSSQRRNAWRNKRVLVVCQKGNSRSVGMANLLKQCGADALAAGSQTSSYSTLCMLYEWAEVIIVMSQRFAELVPEDRRWKVLVCEVGTDTYARPLSVRLVHQCVSFLQR